MKRTRRWFLIFILSGWHCHPLGLLVAGLILATIGSAGLGAPARAHLSLGPNNA